ncbi:cell division protein SepF [Robinsoniella peoriensis]
MGLLNREKYDEEDERYDLSDKRVQVFTPKEQQIMYDIVEAASYQVVLMNMENMEPQEKQKMMDFISGAIFVLEIRLFEIAENIYILMPRGSRIREQL